MVAEVCDDMAVIYAGEIIELGSKEAIFDHPTHPYTLGLFKAVPHLYDEEDRLSPIAGLPPDPSNLPAGCHFSPRCPFATEQCRSEKNRVERDRTGTFLPLHQELPTRRDNMPALVEVKNLKKYFETPRGMLHAVDDVSFSIEKGKTMGIVGESGCGKSTLGRIIIHLLDSTDGSIYFEGEDITEVNSRKLQKLRENMKIIFQDPFSSLNPRMTVEQTIMEPLTISGRYSRKESAR